MSLTSGINNTINTSIPPSGGGKVTTSILASVILGVVAWDAATFLSLGGGQIAGGQAQSISPVGNGTTTLSSVSLTTLVVTNGIVTHC